MSDIKFGKLEDLPLRTAWKHEAQSFTPWLAENIDHLSDAIGIPLELTDTEVAVESFAADILARNPPTVPKSDWQLMRKSWHLFWAVKYTKMMAVRPISPVKNGRHPMIIRKTGMRSLIGKKSAAKPIVPP